MDGVRVMGRRVPGGSMRVAARRALERRLAPFRDLARTATPPPAGWVRPIREALGMSAADLADRMGVTETSALRLEISERQGRIRMDSLRRAAEALDCDVVYAIVPRKPLEQMVQEQAQTKAAQEFGRVAHTMLLEDQQVSDDVASEQLREFTSQLLDSPDLWHSSRR